MPTGQPKQLSNLIGEMVKNPDFAKKVLAAPEKFQVKYNLTPRNVKALKAASFERLVKGRGPSVSGGCYYGG
jgi:hypothetical protein